MTPNGIFQLVLYIVVLLALAKPLGLYMARVYEGRPGFHRTVLGWLERLTQSRIQTIHVVGGGAQNRLLCQMTADACDRRVLAGPMEATAIGNVMMQAVASSDVGSISQARQLIRRSFDVTEYTPRHDERWSEASTRFCHILQLKTG